MKLTRFDIEEFKKLGACGPGIDNFTKKWGRYFVVNLDNIKFHSNSDINWVSKKFFGPKRKEYYDNLINTKHQEYKNKLETLESIRNNEGFDFNTAFKKLKEDFDSYPAKAFFQASQEDLD